MSENWSQYAREVQAASDAGYRHQQKKIDALAKERDELRAELCLTKDNAHLVYGRANRAEAEVGRLTAERDQARAQIAAVIERAADKAFNFGQGAPYNQRASITALAASIRALTPTDAAEALNQMLNEAYKAGQRDMRERAAGETSDWFYNHVNEVIRALPIKERNE